MYTREYPPFKSVSLLSLVPAPFRFLQSLARIKCAVCCSGYFVLTVCEQVTHDNLQVRDERPLILFRPDSALDPGALSDSAAH